MSDLPAGMPEYGDGPTEKEWAQNLISSVLSLSGLPYVDAAIEKMSKEDISKVWANLRGFAQDCEHELAKRLSEERPF